MDVKAAEEYFRITKAKLGDGMARPCINAIYDVPLPLVHLIADGGTVEDVETWLKLNGG